MTVQEFLEGVISYDLKRPAHTAYWAIREGFVNTNDDMEKLVNLQRNEKAIQWLMEQNVLCMERIKLYVIRSSKEGWYAFYFAEDAESVAQLHRAMFRENPTHITNASHLMANVMHFVEQGVDMMLFEYREQVVEFPAYIGHAYARQTALYRLGGTA